MLRAVNSAMLHQILTKGSVAGHLWNDFILPNAPNRLQHIVEAADGLAQ